MAAIGVWASHHFADPRLDGIASIAIGLVLGGVAILLAREAKGLLIGESADGAIVETVWRLLDQRPEITAVNHVRTIHTAPDAVFVAISADFADELPMGRIEELESAMKRAIPELTSIYIRPEKREDAVIQPRPS